jgi:hypothetical protein
VYTRLSTQPRHNFLDDLAATGASLRACCEVVQGFGARVVSLYTLIDREQGTRERFAAHGLRYRPLITLSELVQHATETWGARCQARITKNDEDRRTCDVFIEVHHLTPEAKGGTNDEDNAMPLCFDCHAKVSHYDGTQPLGTKFKPEELKKRRNQVYDECTRHLVPALGYKVWQGRRRLPDTGFTVHHLVDAPPVQLLVTLDVYIDGVPRNDQMLDPIYRGKLRWNLNPKEGVDGHFSAVDEVCQDNVDVRVGVNIVIYDVYERPHVLLPVTYVYERRTCEWRLDPVDPKASIARNDRTIPY